MMMAGVACEVGICGLVGHTAKSMVNELGSSSCRDITGSLGKGLSRILDEDAPIDLVLLMAGTNDLGTGGVPQEIADDICKLHSICHVRGVPTISIAPPTVTSEQKRFHRESRDQLADLLAARIGARVGHDDGVLAHFDSEELLPRTPGSTYWEPDQIHFSVAGSIHLGKLLAAWILPAVVDAFKPVQISASLGSPKPVSPGSDHRCTTTRRSTSPSRATSPVRTRSPARMSNRGAAAGGRRPSKESLSSEEPFQGTAPISTSPTSSMSGSDQDSSPSSTSETVTTVTAVEVWSKTHSMWCKGLIRKTEGNHACVEYLLPNGGLARKVLSLDHRELRVLHTGITITSNAAMYDGAAVRKTCSAAPQSPTQDFRQVAVY